MPNTGRWSPYYLQRTSLVAMLDWGRRMGPTETLRLPGLHALRPRGVPGPGVLAIFGLDPRAARGRIDQAIAFLGEAPAQEVFCWPIHPLRPPGLGALLLARGFDTNWHSNWMWLDLMAARLENADPAELRIERVQSPLARSPDDLPYYYADEVAIIVRSGRRGIQRLRQYIGFVGDQPVAQCVLHLVPGDIRAAMIRNVGVVSAARRRGYGAAITQTALRDARAAGFRLALLSATDEGQLLYERLGFQAVGRGPTWILRGSALPQLPVPPEQVALAEAAGLGDLASLRTCLRTTDPALLDRPLPNKLTPLQIAAAASQPQAIELLIKHGATLAPLTAWELGWHERAAQLLKEQPGLANLRYGPMDITALHQAVWSDDRELASIVLRANPDLSIADSVHSSTALGWARFFGRTEIVGMIENQETRNQNH